MTGITRDDWEQALREATRRDLPPDDPSVLTAQELATMLHIDIRTANRKLRILVHAGIATQTKKHVLKSDGSYYPVPAYRLRKDAMPDDVSATERTLDGIEANAEPVSDDERLRQKPRKRPRRSTREGRRRPHRLRS